MCCRYLFDESTLKDIWETVQEVDQRINPKMGDIHPADFPMVIRGQQSKLLAQTMRWGIQNNYSKQLLINARAETALSKPTFSLAVSRCRCLIPAKHFYEWDREKNKNTFSLKKGRTMYMAGIYLPYADGNRFSILTTAANASMQPVHDRMPLILPESEIHSWIFDDEKVAWFLGRKSPELRRYQEYEQLSFVW